MPFAAKKHKHMETANQNSKFPDWSDAMATQRIGSTSSTAAPF